MLIQGRESAEKSQHVVRRSVKGTVRGALLLRYHLITSRNQGQTSTLEAHATRSLPDQGRNQRSVTGNLLRKDSVLRKISRISCERRRNGSHSGGKTKFLYTKMNLEFVIKRQHRVPLSRKSAVTIQRNKTTTFQHYYPKLDAVAVLYEHAPLHEKIKQ